MSPPLSQVTEETLANIAKAQTTGILESTGIYSYDLSGLVSLIPVVTPFRDIVSRTKSPDGAPMAVWRAIMNLTNSQPDPAIGFDYAGAEVLFSEQDFQARYMPLALAGVVTQDAFDMATGYADPYSISTFNVLNQMLIAEDRKLLGAQSFALATPGTPVNSALATGNIGAASLYVGVAARTGSGYYFGSGNSRGAVSAVCTVSGSGNSVSSLVAPVRGAVAYDWFQAASSTGPWYYYTTTTTSQVLMTSVISANNALPSSTLCPDLSTKIPTFSSAADNGSANANDYDGFLASLTGDYNGVGQWVTSGTGGAGGAANPSIWNSLGPGPLTLTGGSVNEIEEYLFLPLWTAIKSSPTAIMVSASQAQEIANLILSQPSAVTYLQTDEAGRANVTAGGRIGSLINAPAGGISVPIEVHTSLPPGTIIARTDRVPFPQANISSVLECRCLRDTAQFDYGISRVANAKGGGPRREFELRTVAALCNKAPVAMAVLSNIT